MKYEGNLQYHCAIGGGYTRLNAGFSNLQSLWHRSKLEGTLTSPCLISACLACTSCTRTDTDCARSDMPVPLMWRNSTSIIHPITNFNLLPLHASSFLLWSLAHCCLRSERSNWRRQIVTFSLRFFSFLNKVAFFPLLRKTNGPWKTDGFQPRKGQQTLLNRQLWIQLGVRLLAHDQITVPL